MSLFDEVSKLSTEQRNPASVQMDELGTSEILALINDEDAKVAAVVRGEIPVITKVVEELIARFTRGGRLFYLGAGTSGRMGVVDASECPPTFGTDPTMVQAIMAGGDAAVFRSREGAEDDPENGAQEVRNRQVNNTDLVVGIAASKRTPFVLGALETAHKLGAYTVLLTTNPRSEVNFDFLDEAICPVVGPEVLMGSTRMKSAVAQKMVLTMITTTAMVRLGKVYENMMVDLHQTNKKLEERSKRIIMLATGCDYDRAAELLLVSGKHVKTAIVMQMKNVDRAEAVKLLVEHDGFTKQAIRAE
jgi:N-acetylmuramic acid 6-phosphate etherase